VVATSTAVAQCSGEHAVLITVRSDVSAEAQRELAALRAGIVGWPRAR
jgi:hypothetical protein